MERVNINGLTADRTAFAALALWNIYFQEQPTTFFAVYSYLQTAKAEYVTLSLYSLSVVISEVIFKKFFCDLSPLLEL